MRKLFYIFVGIILTYTLLFCTKVVIANIGDIFDTGNNHEFRIDSDGINYTKYGNQIMQEWIDIPTYSTQAFNGSSGAAGRSISTSTLVSGGTTYTFDNTAANNRFTQITFPRNITCTVDFANSASTSTCTGTLLVSGKDSKGNSVTDTISVSTGTAAAPGNGVVAFSFIDSFKFSGFTIVTYEPATAPNAQLFIGTGNKIGLGFDVIYATDVYKTTIDNVDVSTCAYKSENGVNPTYDTMDTTKYGGSLPPNASRDYRIWGKGNVGH